MAGERSPLCEGCEGGGCETGPVVVLLGQTFDLGEGKEGMVLLSSDPYCGKSEFPEDVPKDAIYPVAVAASMFGQNEPTVEG